MRRPDHPRRWRGAALVLATVVAVAGCGGRRATDDFAGIVAAATPEAAEAGVAVLEAGGNAVDAAVAVAFTLGVTEPAMSGLGGGVQILVARPGAAPVVINGTSWSPGRTPVGATRADLVGARATTVPSAVRTLGHAWRHHGSGRLTWDRLLAPAIRYAEEGFVVGPFRARVWAREADALRQDPATRGLFLNPDGTSPTVGAVWRQPVLARTLRRLAVAGPEEFYSGGIARDIAADMRARGGWMTLDDLRDQTGPTEQEPLEGRYRRWRVLTLPPPGSGWVVLQVLNVLEQSSSRSLALGSPERALRLAEALAIGHEERRARPVPDQRDYGAAVAARIHKDTAGALLARARLGRGGGGGGGGGETTHFSVVDGAGMAVAVTASINAYFGAKVAAPALGFLYNDYMQEFEIGEPGHPFALRPRAMPYSSMSPTVVLRGTEPVLVLGSPGSSRIISAVVQVVQLWADAGVPVDSAVAVPRLHAASGRRVYAEAPLRAGVTARLERAGYTLVHAPADLAAAGGNPYFGGVHALARESQGWRGAADSRRDGVVRYARRAPVTGPGASRGGP